MVGLVGVVGVMEQEAAQGLLDITDQLKEAPGHHGPIDNVSWTSRTN